MRLHLFLAILVTACSSSQARQVIDPLDPAPIDPAEPPATFSAPNVFFIANSISAIITVDGMDPVCPMVTRSASETVIEGGCTDDQGVEWFGRAVLPPSEEGTETPPNGTATYDGFGSERPSGCATNPGATITQITDGTVQFSSSLTSLTFEVDLVLHGSGTDSDCETNESDVGIEYSGSAAIGGEASTWNGSGRIGADRFGRYDVRTDDEVLNDSVCDSEALSGSTTVTGSDVAVFTYDGATDCDMESTVTWTLNGEDQGELQGVACSASPGRGVSWIAIAALALALVRWRRA